MKIGFFQKKPPSAPIPTFVLSPKQYFEGHARSAWSWLSETGSGSIVAWKPKALRQFKREETAKSRRNIGFEQTFRKMELQMAANSLVTIHWGYNRGQWTGTWSEPPGKVSRRYLNRVRSNGQMYFRKLRVYLLENGQKPKKSRKHPKLSLFFLISRFLEPKWLFSIFFQISSDFSAFIYTVSLI